MNRLQRLFFIGLLMFFNILSCTNLHWVKFVLALYLAYVLGELMVLMVQEARHRQNFKSTTLTYKNSMAAVNVPPPLK